MWWAHHRAPPARPGTSPSPACSGMSSVKRSRQSNPHLTTSRVPWLWPVHFCCAAPLHRDWPAPQRFAHTYISQHRQGAAPWSLQAAAEELGWTEQCWDVTGAVPPFWTQLSKSQRRAVSAHLPWFLLPRARWCARFRGRIRPSPRHPTPAHVITRARSCRTLISSNGGGLAPCRCTR
jgi:hypothetical protein